MIRVAAGRGGGRFPGGGKGTSWRGGETGGGGGNYTTLAFKNNFS